MDDQTEAKQKNLQGQPGRRNNALIERDIEMYRRKMSGVSLRAIGEEYGLKSSQSVFAACERGKGHVKDRGIDVEERRIEIDELFKSTIVVLAHEVKRQSIEGRITTIERSDGSKEVRRYKGVEPRAVEALARSADRWGAFLGLTDRAAEVSTAATVIQLASPADGASFSDRWNQAAEPSKAVDVTTTPVANPSLEAGS